MSGFNFTNMPKTSVEGEEKTKTNNPNEGSKDIIDQALSEKLKKEEEARLKKEKKAEEERLKKEKKAEEERLKDEAKKLEEERLQKEKEKGKEKPTTPTKEKTEKPVVPVEEQSKDVAAEEVTKSKKGGRHKKRKEELAVIGFRIEENMIESLRKLIKKYGIDNSLSELMEYEMENYIKDPNKFKQEEIEEKETGFQIRKKTVKVSTSIKIKKDVVEKFRETVETEDDIISNIMETIAKRVKRLYLSHKKTEKEA